MVQPESISHGKLAFRKRIAAGLISLLDLRGWTYPGAGHIGYTINKNKSLWYMKLNGKNPACSGYTPHCHVLQTTSGGPSKESPSQSLGKWKSQKCQTMAKVRSQLWETNPRTPQHCGQEAVTRVVKWAGTPLAKPWFQLGLLHKVRTTLAILHLRRGQV